MFPADIMNCMKECILALFWPRRDIETFFRSNGCTKADLKTIAAFKERDISRNAMVDAMFAQLTSRPDGGLGPFRAMLHSLINWSHFDSYWFETKQKLDRRKAERSLEHLRQLQEIRDARIEEQRKRREQDERNKQEPTETLQGLRRLFLDLHAGKTDPQRRGYILQDILLDLARLSKLETTDPFTVRGEQVDGAVKYDGEHYIVEAKWQDKASSNEPLYQFAGKVEGKMYGRGLFISINGFSLSVVESLVQGKALRTILVDGEDLVLVLEGHLDFTTMIDTKVKAAQTKGHIYIHPISAAVKRPAV